MGFPGTPDAAEQPEDTTGEWLTVNVWTPDTEARTLPVMVWIHGGAYLFGAGGPGYDGTPFASAGVVFVSCNYRLGMEGFAQIAGAPANRGLLDAVAALRWVRDNIERFGGDPGNVTVFGESAGAGVISALLAMDDAKGLFKRAIAQSVPGTFFSSELAGRITEAIAATAGLPADYEALSEADPMRLVAAQMNVTGRMTEFLDWGAVRITDTPFSPVVDGEVLTRTPWRALVSGAARDVELLTGHNRDEYRLFIAMKGRLGHISEDEANTVLDYFAPAPDGPAGYRKAYPNADAGGLFEVAFSDWLFRMPTLHLAQAHAMSGGTTYLYELAAQAPAAVRRVPRARRAARLRRLRRGRECPAHRCRAAGRVRRARRPDAPRVAQLRELRPARLGAVRHRAPHDARLRHPAGRPLLSGRGVDAPLGAPHVRRASLARGAVGRRGPPGGPSSARTAAATPAGTLRTAW